MGKLKVDNTYYAIRTHLKLPYALRPNSLGNFKESVPLIYPKIQHYLAEKRDSPLIRRNLFKYYQYTIPKNLYPLGKFAGEVFDVKVVVYTFIPDGDLNPITSLLFIGPQYNVYLAIRLFRYLYRAYTLRLEYLTLKYRRKAKQDRRKAKRDETYKRKHPSYLAIIQKARLEFWTKFEALKIPTLVAKYKADKDYLNSRRFRKLQRRLDRVLELNFPLNIGETKTGRKSKKLYGTKHSKCLNPWVKTHHYEAYLKEELSTKPN